MGPEPNVPCIRPDAAAAEALMRFSQASPIPDGFGVDALPGLAMLDYSEELSEHYESFVSGVASLLVSEGVVSVSLGALAHLGAAQAAAASFAVLGGVGVPIKVFKNRPHWRHLTADPSRPAGKSEGVGAQGLHQDFVNAAYPPRILVLQCIRPDPLGGGVTRLCSLAGILDGLEPPDLSALRQRAFADGVVVDLDHVGDDLNPFAVANPGSPFPVRFTAGLLEQPHVEESLVRLAEVLAAREFRLRLHAGDLLFVDQTRFLHGRTALGEGQGAVAPRDRRLLLQSYLTRIAPIGAETGDIPVIAA